MRSPWILRSMRHCWISWLTCMSFLWSWLYGALLDVSLKLVKVCLTLFLVISFSFAADTLSGVIFFFYFGSKQTGTTFISLNMGKPLVSSRNVDRLTSALCEYDTSTRPNKSSPDISLAIPSTWTSL